MPHSGYTICTSEQRPASTTVSHGFTVGRYSSPPFGSHGPCKHSEPCPMDCEPGVPMQRHHLGDDWDCLHFALRFAWIGTMRQASSIDSLARVSRRAESGPAQEVPSSAAICTRSPVGDQRPSTATTIRMVQPPVQPPEPKPLEAMATGDVRRHHQVLCLPALLLGGTFHREVVHLCPDGGLDVAQHTFGLCVLSPLHHHLPDDLHKH